MTQTSTGCAESLGLLTQAPGIKEFPSCQEFSCVPTAPLRLLGEEGEGREENEDVLKLTVL